MAALVERAVATDASPPVSLRSAVVDAPGTRLLLITAGDVGAEGRSTDVEAGAV